MIDIDKLSKRLTFDEYSFAAPLFDRIVAEGHSPTKAAAMVYHCGRLDGRDSYKDKLTAVYKELHALKVARRTSTPMDINQQISQPEATVEGSMITNE